MSIVKLENGNKLESKVLGTEWRIYIPCMDDSREEDSDALNVLITDIVELTGGLTEFTGVGVWVSEEEPVQEEVHVLVFITEADLRPQIYKVADLLIQRCAQEAVLYTCGGTSYLVEPVVEEANTDLNFSWRGDKGKIS